MPLSYPDSIKINQSDTKQINGIFLCSYDNKLKSNTNSNEWIITQNSIHKLCGYLDNAKYKTSSVYYSNYYCELLYKMKIMGSTYETINVNSVDQYQIDNDFFNIKDNMIIEYTIVNLSDINRYIKRDIIEKLIREYLINNEIMLMHNQIFLINYANNEVSTREMIIGVTINLKVSDGFNKGQFNESNNCKGIKFSQTNQNITFEPTPEMIRSIIFHDYEKIKSIDISWSYSHVSDKKTCNFVESNNLKKWIYSKLDGYAIKNGTKGRFNIDDDVIDFTVMAINNNSSNENNMTMLYCTTDTIVDYVYTYSKKQTNLHSDKNVNTLLKIMTGERIESIQNKCYDDKNELNDDVLTNNFILRYNPSTNGNVAFVNSLEPTLIASSISINVNSDVNNSNASGYLLWKQQYTEIVHDLLQKITFINCAKIKKYIDGNDFEISITNYEPRNLYSSNALYSPSASVRYDKNITKLNINATNSKTEQKYKVIIADDDCEDTLLSTDCHLKIINNVNIENDKFTQLLQLLIKEKNKINDTIMLDDASLFGAIKQINYVWDGLSIDFVVPQYNVAINMTFKNTIWNQSKTNNNFSNTAHVGKINVRNVKINWITDNEIFVVSSFVNRPKELLLDDIKLWTKNNKIGGHTNTIWDIYRHLIILRNPLTLDILKKNGLKPSKGVILHGPPGNGKTKIARSIGKLLGSLNENIILCSATELLSKWLGESEKNIAKLFEPAEKAYQMFGNKAPLYTIIIDEIEIIAQQRGTSGDTSCSRDGMVNQLLTKIDGLVEKDNIILIGLTNRIDTIDQAILREGRLDRKIHIGFPDLEGRNEILDMYVRPWINLSDYSEQKIFDTVNFLALNAEHFSGSDLQGYASYVVKEYWSGFIGCNDNDSDSINRNFIPIDLFSSYLKEYKKVRSME